MKLNDSCLRLGCLNIEKNKHLDRVFPELKERDFDVICLQEVPEDAASRLASTLNASLFYVPMAWRFDVEVQVERAFGLALFVRKDANIVAYDELIYHTASPTDLPFPSNRMLQYATIEKDGVRYHIGNTHFAWTPDGDATDAQHEELDVLFGLMDEKVRHGIILCGDFNAPRGGPIWEKLSLRFRDNIPSPVITTLDQEYHRAAPIFYVVDGMFTSAHYEAYDIEVVSGISDHMLIAGNVVRVLY
jgi:endonuclease/exonuclease/phosphatase family metal-dependent hydrolase